MKYVAVVLLWICGCYSALGQDSWKNDYIYFQWEGNSTGVGIYPVVSSWTIGYNNVIKKYFGLSAQLHIIDHDGLRFDYPDVNGNLLEDFPQSLSSLQLRLAADLYLIQTKSFDWKFVVGGTIGQLSQNLWQGTHSRQIGDAGNIYIDNINLRDEGFDGIAVGVELETQLLYKWKQLAIGPTISLAGATREYGFQSYGVYLAYRIKSDGS